MWVSKWKSVKRISNLRLLWSNAAKSSLKLCEFILLHPFECGIHLICELLCRGEVMQGVMRREKRVVMVEICMVVEEVVVEEVLLQPARSRLVRQVRGQIYSWRGQRLLVWRFQTVQIGLPSKIALLLTSERTDRFWLRLKYFKKPIMCFAMCTNALELGPKKRLYVHNWHCHGKCALMSGDIEPNHLQCRLHYLLCTLKLPEYMDMPHFEYALEQMLIECVTIFFCSKKETGWKQDQTTTTRQDNTQRIGHIFLSTWVGAS